MTSRVIFLLLLLVSLPARASAERVLITSDPPGALVAIEERTGTTPFEADFPGGYFHEPRSLFGKHLSRPLVARVTLEGYENQEVILTLGPREWVSNNGHKRYQYFVFRSTHFHVLLTRPGEPNLETMEAQTVRKTAAVPEIDQTEMIQRSKQAVVHLRGPDRDGSGFFLTKSGILTTNAHVARGQGALFADLSDGTKLEADTVCIDPIFDVAFLRVKGKGFHPLRLAEADARPGEEIFALGSPGEAMPFSLTKGIVSAIGPLSKLGPGTWIQTDAAINTGTSGGPLLNTPGEAVGMITQKIVKEGVSGIGFAQSSMDVRIALKRCDEKLALENMAEEKPHSEEDTGMVVFSQPEGAEIFVDRVLMGMVPAMLPLRAGRHSIRVEFHGQFPVVHREIYVVKGGQVTITIPPAAPID
jgi:S1-C subfamily serine protease